MKPLGAVAVIVSAQLLGTSLWFSTNGAGEALTQAWNLSPTGIAWLTNATQFGFVLGTLVFAATGLADRYRASRIFAVSGGAGATFNALFATVAGGLASGMAFRFAVGLALAGIYPLGMKLLVGWVPDRAGRALGLLVGMLTLGTALPHAVRMLGSEAPWQGTVLVSSALAIVGALGVYLVGDGPTQRTGGTGTFAVGNIFTAFELPRFRAAALGYFGHMWELYAFWSLVPWLVAGLGISSPREIAGWSFAIIGIGAVGCVTGGLLSHRMGSARVALCALMVSSACCALFPFISALSYLSAMALLLVWGIAVVADSPQFSAIAARESPPARVGAALALQNSAGFLIAMLSIALCSGAYPTIGAWVAWVVLPGPLFGALALRPLINPRSELNSIAAD